MYISLTLKNKMEVGISFTYKDVTLPSYNVNLKTELKIANDIYNAVQKYINELESDELVFTLKYSQIDASVELRVVGERQLVYSTIEDIRDVVDSLYESM